MITLKKLAVVIHINEIQNFVKRGKTSLTIEIEKIIKNISNDMKYIATGNYGANGFIHSIDIVNQNIAIQDQSAAFTSNTS